MILLKKKLLSLFKENYLNFIYITLLGAISSYSLPPYNYYIINFITFSLFFIFLFNKKNTYLGDIVISYEFMNKPKSLNNLDFKKRVIKIFVHGYLHLLGYDHIRLNDFKKMIKEEKKIYNFVNKKIEKLI